jgi:hypothetical protein
MVADPIIIKRDIRIRCIHDATTADDIVHHIFLGLAPRHWSVTGLRLWRKILSGAV